MAISDAEYTAWLKDNSALRCILVEAVARVGGVETTRYLSTTTFHDGVAGRNYKAIVVGNSVSIVERLSLDGSSTLSFGDIEIVNTDGTLDSWLNDIWAGRAIECYIGGVDWPRADFRPIFIGVTEDIDSRSKSTLNLKIRDKLQRLNAPISEDVLGGSTANKNQLIPLTFGEVHNIRPLLKDPATLEEKVHDGQIERIIEMRTNGVPSGKTDDLANGEFTPDVNPQGTTITVDVQGAKPGGTYLTTVKEIIEHLVTTYGEASQRFTAGDLDSSNLSAFDSANPQKIGIHINRRENLLQTCNDIAASVGAQLVPSRAGKLQLHKIALPAPGTPTAITQDDIKQNSIAIVDRPAVIGAVNLRYAKNWHVQDNLDTRIPQGHKDKYAKEWDNVIVEDSSVKSLYRLHAEPEPIDTFLITESDASTEANRLLTLWKSPRHVIGLKGEPNLTELTLGQAVTLTHPRFNLSGGVNGMVIGLSINWKNLSVDVEVLI